MIEAILIILFSITIIVGLVILQSVNKRKRRRTRLLISPSLARRSRAVMQELCGRFEKNNGRLPDKHEVVRLIIMASHGVITPNTPESHELRRKIRLFLASEYKVWFGKNQLREKQP